MILGDYRWLREYEELMDASRTLRAKAQPEIASGWEFVEITQAWLDGHINTLEMRCLKRDWKRKWEFDERDIAGLCWEDNI